MILNFSTKYPPGTRLAGKDTGFIPKVLSDEKPHTIRDSVARFQKSMYDAEGADRPITLHIYTGSRTTLATCWGEKQFTGYQELMLFRDETGKLERVLVDCSRNLTPEQISDLVRLDGFAHEFDFVEWMFLGQPPAVRSLRKYLVHWTALRY